MASIRNLKKDLNFVLGDIIEAVFNWENSVNKRNSKEGAKIIDSAISTFDELIVKINNKDVDNRKAHLKKVRLELEEKATKLIEKVNGLA